MKNIPYKKSVEWKHKPSERLIGLRFVDPYFEGFLGGSFDAFGYPKNLELCHHAADYHNDPLAQYIVTIHYNHVKDYREAFKYYHFKLHPYV